MSTLGQRTLIAVLMVALSAALCPGAVLDWAVEDWSAGALSQAFVVDGVNVSMAFTGDTGRFLTSHPLAPGVLPDDDHGWAVTGLWYASEFIQAGESLTLTITFDQPVRDVVFNVYDVDGVAPMYENTAIAGSLASVAVSPSSIVAGANINVVPPAVLQSDGTFDGQPGDAANTATVTFSNDVDTITLNYTSIIDVERGQLLGNITFVPEPASLALLGLGSLLIARRRR